MTASKSFRIASVTTDLSPRPLLEDQFPCQELLTIPILNHQKHLLGVVECRNRVAGTGFGIEDDLDDLFVATLALQIASGLEKGRIFHHLIKWNQAMESLFAFNASLNQDLDPPVLVRRLVEHAVQFLGASSGWGGLSTAQMTPHATEYWFDGQWVSTEVQLDQKSIPLFVYKHQCPFLTNEYQTEELALPEFRERFLIQNALAVPFLDGEDVVLGFIEIHNKDGGREPFTWSDVSFLESLGHTMAVTLRNARLLQELDENRKRMQALSIHQMNILEEERTKISRELHDEAGQALIGIKLNLQLLEKQIPEELGVLREHAQQLRREINRSTSTLRDIARSLRSPALEELGLEAAIQQLTNQIRKQTDLTIEFEKLGEPQRLPQDAEITCFRIVQEALVNAVRHADAKTVWVVLTYAAHKVNLVVRDDGRGFDIKHNEDGLGLLGIRERVTMLNCSLKVNSTIGAGTEIMIEIPTRG